MTTEIKSKPCSKCKLTKPVSEFQFRHIRGVWRAQSACKLCNKQYAAHWNLNNQEKLHASYKAKWARDKDKIRARIKELSLLLSPEEKAKRAQKKSDYMRVYMRERLRRDVAFRLLFKARNRLWYVTKGTARAGRTISLIGCTPEELKAHLEKQFLPGWTWADWGKVFEIDHIIPCSKFDMTDPAQQRACFHYTNLQPLEKMLNRQKWNKIIAA